MTKIEALEKTIYNLENDVYEYRWHDFATCNIGVLARTILGGEKMTNKEPNFVQDGIGLSGCIEETITHCTTTGLELPKSVKALVDLGFTAKDLNDLEIFQNPSICKRAGVLQTQYEHKQPLIEYLKAWVEILKEEKMIEEPEVKRSVATEEKSERWADNTKKFTELIPVVEEVADCEVKIISD